MFVLFFFFLVTRVYSPGHMQYVCPLLCHLMQKSKRYQVELDGEYISGVSHI
ncbi:hypothetical protein RND81_04G068900 [Saponaria officinalis]|uniref:Uncharacterized protein n=1 Tax=Saponaria officinalis TaxID=3572 RepID=A0AAW1LD66_SAPOF